jgi:hypothetical protein
MAVVTRRRRPPVTVSDEARARIEQEGLEGIVAGIKASVMEQWKEGARINEVAVEWLIDPEIKGWERLGITIWMKDVSPEEASSLQRALDKQISEYEATLTSEEREKLDKLVLWMVDID